MKTLTLFLLIFRLASAYAITLEEHIQAGRISEKDVALLKAYQENPDNLPTAKIRNQCLGTCYAEGTLNAIDHSLQLSGKDLIVSRMHFWWYHSIQRLDGYMITNLVFDKVGGRDLAFDIFSGGDTSEVIKTINKYGIVTIPPLTQAQRHQENQLQEEFFHNVSNYLKELHSEFRDERSKFKHFKQRYYKLTIKLHQTLATPEIKENILSERLDPKLTMKLSMKSMIQELENAMALLELYTKKMKLSKELQSQLTSLHIGYRFIYNDLIEIRDLYQARLAQSAVKEIQDMARGMIRKFGLDPNTTPENFNSLTTDVNHGFLKVLDISKENVVVLNFNIHRSAITHGKNEGVVIYRDELGSPDGAHAVRFHDVIRDEYDRVRFVVIENSWGVSKGHNGYLFIHSSYFKYIQSIISIDAQKLAPAKLKRPCLQLVEALI